ncbi:DUF4062 domain-containing protein [Clostridiales bacterium FE2011]|nr:DUF4062 domain-containing protein [Clostridiales bacterium FE2011]
MEIKYQVFISSTYDDLREERNKVQDAILSMHHFPVGMELFGAANEEQWEIIKETIDTSDYYVLIVGHRYGTVIEDGPDAGISYTEKEFKYAKEKGIPILALLIDKSVPVLPDYVEKTHTRAFDKFKSAVKKGRNVDWWKNPDDLAQKVTAALYKQIERTPRPGWIRADSTSSKNTPQYFNIISGENQRLHDRNAELEKSNARYYDNYAELKKKYEVLLSSHKDLENRYETLYADLEESKSRNRKEPTKPSTSSNSDESSASTTANTYYPSAKRDPSMQSDPLEYYPHMNPRHNAVPNVIKPSLSHLLDNALEALSDYKMLLEKRYCPNFKLVEAKNQFNLTMKALDERDLSDTDYKHLMLHYNSFQSASNMYKTPLIIIGALEQIQDCLQSLRKKYR